MPLHQSFASVVICLCTCVPSAFAAAVSSHPILGSWRFSSSSGCQEIYVFNADKTRDFSSGKEVGRSHFGVTQNPSKEGFYLLTDTILKTNGGQDCSGGITPIGDTAELYIRFNSTADLMMFCNSESLSDCFGPFSRDAAQ